MNVPEFAQALEAAMILRSQEVASEVVASDLGPTDTAKQRGIWWGLLEARKMLEEHVNQLTQDQTPPAEPPADQPQEEPVY